MKAAYILAIVYLTIAGCSKNATQIPAGLEGTWELACEDGGWVGHEDFPRGNGNTITFNGNNYSQTIVTDSAYHYSGTFKIFRGKACGNTTEETLISFDNNQTPESFNLSGYTLSIGASMCFADGADLTYRKIQ